MDRPQLKRYSIDNIKPAAGQRVLIADDFADDVSMATYIALEEYEALMKENARMKEALKRHGITLIDKE